MTARFEEPDKKQAEAIDAISDAVLIGSAMRGYDGNIILSAIAKIMTHLLLAYPELSFEEAVAGVATAIQFNLKSFREANAAKMN